MPFVRCKFYTESGDPVREGCRRKGAGCPFIHPDDPNWATAPEPSFRSRDKGGDTSKPWDRGKRSGPPPSPLESNASATDTGSGGWEPGGWQGSGWGGGGGGGWDTGESASAPSSALSKSQSTWDTPVSANTKNQTEATSASTNGGWGGGWGNTSDGAWGASGWGNDKDTGKTTGSGTGNTDDGGRGSSGWGNNQKADKTSAGSTGDNGLGLSSWGDKKTADKNAEPVWGGGWGSGWGGDKDADKNAELTWGGAGNDGSGSGWGNKDNDKNAGSSWGNAGSGWGNDDNATKSRRDSQSMVVDSQAGNASGPGKGKGRTVIPPPRIRIPDNENKRVKQTGTNNEPLGPSRWGEPRPSISIPATVLTPVAMSTPTESIHGKRKRDTMLNDTFDVFKEYVKAWERAVRAKFSLAEAETKQDRWRRTQKSACYTRIGEAGRDRLDGQRIELHKECTSQREKLTTSLSMLMDLHEKLASNLDLGQRYNIGEEAQKFISESKAFVDETRALLVARVLKEKDDGQSGDTQKQPSEADATSIDALRSRITQLEERFEQAQTELTLRRERDLRSEIDELLTAKIQALRAARQQEIDRVASKPRPEIVIPPSALKTMEATAQQVSEIGTKVPHTVEDIRALLLQVDAMTKRVSQLEEEVSRNKETYRKQVEGMIAEKEEAERQMDKKLQDIQGQFQQLIASQPPAASTPTPTTQELQGRFMENLQPLLETVMTKFYEVQVLPAVEAVQELAITQSRKQQEAAMSKLWGQMKPAMSMVEGVSRWLDSHELGLTAPIEEDQST